MSIEELNRALGTLLNANPVKTIPYMGWYWRPVSEHDLSLGCEDGWVGIMQNNKWGYPSYRCTVDEARVIIGLLEAFVTAPTLAHGQAVFDHLQTFRARCV